MEDYQKICLLDNEIEASLLASILEERKIPHIIRSYHDSAYDGLFQFQKGWGHIEAPLQYKNEIVTILDDLHQQNPNSSLEE